MAGASERSSVAAASSTAIASSSPGPAACSTWWARWTTAHVAARQGAIAARPWAPMPPAAWRRLVDRVPHDRVPEREAARRAAGPHQRLEKQHVQRGERVRLVELGHLRGDAGLERVADDGGRVEQPPGAGGAARRSPPSSAAATAGGTEPSLSSFPAPRPRASCSR